MDTTLETELDRLDMAGHYCAFMEYARTFYTGKRDHDYHLALKVDHSTNVFLLACDLAKEEPSIAAFPDRVRALAVAALYHDLGRFMQFARYKTFNDMHSENHARIAVREVKRLGFFNTERRRIRHLALAAVFLHNRFAVTSDMDKDALAVTRALRDADKLDIMRIMAGHLAGDGPVDSIVALGAKESPEATPAIVRSVMERRLGSYGDLATTTGFKLLVCGWFYDLNYGHSRRMAVSMGYLRTLFDSLPRTDDLADFLRQYAGDLADHASPS